MSTQLSIALSAAVPLWIHTVRQRGHAAWVARLAEKSGEWSQTLAERGDVLQYGHKKKTKSNEGEVAQLFNMLAEALAHMAFVPGGVRVFGEHWIAEWSADERRNT